LATTHPELYTTDLITARRKVFKLLGGAFHLYAPDGRLIGFSKQKAFKLKEDIRVYADESMSRELLYIQAQSIIDFGAAYRVVDSTTGEHVGTLRRKGFSSMFRDAWEILDHEGNLRGKVTEDSAWYAMIRRLIDLASLIIPQKFVIEVDGKPIGWLAQNNNPFVQKLEIDLRQDDGQLPRPLAIAALILILAIEGRQG